LKNLSEDNWKTSQDVKQVPPEERSRVLPLHHSVWLSEQTSGLTMD